MLGAAELLAGDGLAWSLQPTASAHNRANDKDRLTT
jgi:hypothetical protein